MSKGARVTVVLGRKLCETYISCYSDESPKWFRARGFLFYASSEGLTWASGWNTKAAQLLSVTTALAS